MAGTLLRSGCTKLAMNIASVGVILLVLSVSQEGEAFSVEGRTLQSNGGSPNMDLAEALALLQRERRRVSDRVYIPPEEFLASRAMTESDFSDWLSKDRDGRNMINGDDLDQYLGLDQEPTWVSDGNFQGFAPQTQTVKPSKEEIEDIFSSDSEPEKDSMKKKKKDVENTEGMDKKKKRSSSNTKRKLVKKSVSTPLASSFDGENNLSLDTLTQEEFKALMKAVGKLQSQVASKGFEGAVPGETEILGEIDESDPEQEIAIVQPASKEELQSLFEKEDDDESVNDEEDTTDTEMLPTNRLVMEEEVQTPEGGRRILEVDTPTGGTRVTELDTPDGQQEIVEETLPDDSMGTLQDVLEDSEREISNALASQLESDLSREAIDEELKAEAEEAEKESEEEAETIAAEVESQQSEMAAANEEIEKEIEKNDLAALEKIWMSEGDNLPPYTEKRTTKRAARNSMGGNFRPTGFESRRIPDDLTLERLLSGSDIGDDDESVDEDIIDSINEGVKEAELEREILTDQNIKDALKAIKSDKATKEDIIYGSPLTFPEYEALEEEDDEDNMDENDTSLPVTSLSIKRSRQFDKERLRELANALSMNSDEEDDDDDIFDPSDRLLADNDMGPAEESDEVTRVFQELGIGSGQKGHLPDQVAGLPPPLGKFVTKIVELQDEVGQLRAIAQLSDLENEVLTDALNEATMAQAPGTVSDMEFESLQQAIWVEKELQKLKHTGGIGELSLVREDPGLAEAPDSLSSRKRGEPWRRKRGRAQTGSGTPLQTFPVSSLARPGRPAMKDMVEKLLAETYLDKEDIPDILDDMDMPDDSIASIFLPYADRCPAVSMYSTHCELADLYSLPVDYEARALCNLHEMCYACGHSLNVPQDACDDVYRTAAKTLCREGSACVLEAEIFLRTMKLKTRYVPHRQPTCSHSCTARFLGMF